MTFVTTTLPVELSRLRNVRYFKAIDDQDLNTGAFNSSTSFNTRWQLLRILFHFGAASTDTITITFDSGDGSNYDTVLTTQTLAGSTDITIEGSSDIDVYQKGDELNIQVTTGAGSPHVYVTVLAKEIE